MAARSVHIDTAAVTAAPDGRARHPPLNTMHSRPQQTTNSRWRFNRSTPHLRGSEEPSSAVSTSPQNPKLERTASKMSLFSLFSRPKVEKARGHTELGLAVPMRPQTPPQPALPPTAPKSSLRQNPSPPAQQTIRTRSSQIFRQSMRPSTPSLREFGTWEPPPLFQAFPQSIKHATVQACVFPAEVLMRTHSQRRQAVLLQERMDSARDLSTIAENSIEAKRLEKSHRRLVSNSVLNPPAPELVNKIYILVTTGYVLQYAGDGTFDRTPEKVLKLGKDSAAFACDLIPGKHWVLQISSYAHDDGTVESGPKNSLLSRLRSQNNTIKRTATSFLLVLESAEEMDAWMTVVRKEIDNLGGSKPRDQAERASSSTTDERATDTSVDLISRRYLVQRDPNTVSKISPVESPRQSQYSESPQIVATDWETTRSERTSSGADSTSGQSSLWGNNRQSAEISSVASTPVSQHQTQLDQFRGRSRSSFVSTATSTSGVATQNTSRNSSPAPQSPVKESFPPNVPREPLRSATSLKSFHMNPMTSSASRRRSMQPLPVTNEDFPQVIKTPNRKQRHSLYSPTSPTAPDLGNHFSVEMPKFVQGAAPPAPTMLASNETAGGHLANSDVLVPAQKLVLTTTRQSDATDKEIRQDSPVKTNVRNFSMPPRIGTISPPPREPAPIPPASARRQSILGPLSKPIAGQVSSNPAIAVESRPQRRLSTTPKPFLRPLPVRPQAHHINASMVIPRRQSSLVPITAPAPLPLGINVGRSVTAPVRPSGSVMAAPVETFNSKNLQPTQSLRRPTSVQVRSDSAPFLASSRPARAISTTPSFLPGRRASTAPSSTPHIYTASQTTQTLDVLRQQALAHHTKHMVINSRPSLPKNDLPPPAPPPSSALPPIPAGLPALATGTNIESPSLPLGLSPPSQPPNIPLPLLPPTIRSGGIST
ncbi:hypothetical protein ACN47E_008398 [Coniothyrium glycines]